MQWRTGKPEDSDLQVVFSRPDYTTLGGHFLVSDGQNVWISKFTRPPGYSGYFDEQEVAFWMPLPKPPSK